MACPWTTFSLRNFATSSACVIDFEYSSLPAARPRLFSKFLRTSRRAAESTRVSPGAGVSGDSLQGTRSLHPPRNAMRVDRRRFLYAATAISCDMGTRPGMCRVLWAMARKRRGSRCSATGIAAVPAVSSQLRSSVVTSQTPTALPCSSHHATMLTRP
jgi:hypothetical protein